MCLENDDDDEKGISLDKEAIAIKDIVSFVDILGSIIDKLNNQNMKDESMRLDLLRRKIRSIRPSIDMIDHALRENEKWSKMRYQLWLVASDFSIKCKEDLSDFYEKFFDWFSKYGGIVKQEQEIDRLAKIVSKLEVDNEKLRTPREKGIPFDLISDRCKTCTRTRRYCHEKEEEYPDCYMGIDLGGDRHEKGE